MSSIFSFFNQNEEFQNLSQDEFEELLNTNNDAVLIDVRTQLENQQFALPNSMLIDISSRNFVDEINKLAKEKKYFIYCQSGSRSYQAAKYMTKIGFENVYNLKRGISRWKVS